MSILGHHTSSEWAKIRLVAKEFQKNSFLGHQKQRPTSFSPILGKTHTVYSSSSAGIHELLTGLLMRLAGFANYPFPSKYR